MARRTRGSGAGGVFRLRPEYEETPCASSLEALQGTLQTSFAADRHAQTLATTATTSGKNLAAATGRHAGTITVGTGATEIVGLVGALRHEKLSCFGPEGHEKKQSGPGAPRSWRNTAPAKGPDRYQRAPPLSTQARARLLPLLRSPLLVPCLPTRTRRTWGLHMLGTPTPPPRPDFHLNAQVGSASGLAVTEQRKSAWSVRHCATWPEARRFVL